MFSMITWAVLSDQMPLYIFSYFIYQLMTEIVVVKIWYFLSVNSLFLIELCYAGHRDLERSSVLVP
uniref:Uncharacterized protein n=1 Tax=Arundo donax TaxID=35708 RepID=A0A0A9GS25_ARUDO